MPMQKVKSFIPAERAKDIAIKTNEIFIDLSPWMSNINIQPNLEIIKTALGERKPISFEYVGDHGNKTTRTAEPYQLVLKNSHCYFQGYCLKRNAFCLFKLCRISNLKIKEDILTPREYQKPQLDITEILATIETKIKIRIHKSVMHRVLDYCPYEHFTPDGNNHYIVNFPFIEKEYYYDILLSFGNKCECLEPLHIRQGMKRKIQELTALY